LANGIDVEIAALKAKLEAAEQSKMELERAMSAEIQAKIAGLPAELGVGTLEDVIKMLCGTAKVSRPATGPVRKTPRILAGKLKQVKEALKNGATLAAVADSFGISRASVSNYKSRWGLTHRGGGISSLKIIDLVRTKSLVPEKRKTFQLSLANREGIMRALAADRKSVASIAKEFSTSRQTVYTMRNRLMNYREEAKIEGNGGTNRIAALV
jgi:DNA-binding CsgD family transcriptional regulator